MKKILRNIYAVIPFKKGLFSFLKIIGWQPKENIYRHLHFIGEFQTKLENGKSLKIVHYGNSVENEIFWKGINGGFEKISLMLWSELCKDATCVFDIGANTGIYALTAKTINPNTKVYAFEPISRIYQKLVKNNNINNFDIVCIEKAVSNKDDYELIYDLPTEHVYSASLNREFLRQENSFAIEISTIKLDTFILENQITNIDLIKIDVETYEPEVFEGFQKFIKIFKPTIIVEVLNENVADKLNYLVSNLDYLYFNIDDTNNRIFQTEQICKSDKFNYLLCLKDTALKLQNSVSLNNINWNIVDK